LREIMDCLSDPAIEIVVGMIGSQLGKTEALLNMLGYFVDQDPSPILMVHPGAEVMQDFSKERIDPTFRASPTLRDKLETGKDGRGNSRKSGQTILHKAFPGGYLAMAGSNAPAGLASRPIRVVLCDEVDRFADSAGTEGDPVRLSIQRTSNFHNKKIVLFSTPTIDGIKNKIQEWHAKGDRRQYHVPCPLCGTMQVMVWEGLKYKNDDGERDFDHCYYLCPHCKGRIDERHKPTMLAAGEWIAQQPGGANGTGKIVSFGDLSALYSPWVKWRDLAEQWCDAHDSHDQLKLRVFINTKLGLPFTENDQSLAAKDLERHLENYDCEVPAGVMVLTAGVDLQADRIELEVVGWGPGRESWGIAYRVLMGDPANQAVWQQLDEHLSMIRETEDGRRLAVACTCVDSGYHANEVYAFCAPRRDRYVFASKGSKDGPGVPAIGKPTYNNRYRAALFMLGVHDLKGAVFSRLKEEHPGPSYCHFPRDQGETKRGYGAEYFKGLLSERLVIIPRAGRKIAVWRKPNEHVRNEPLDCRVYATAALEIRVPDPRALDELARRSNGGEAKKHGRQASSPAKPSSGPRMLSKGVKL